MPGSGSGGLGPGEPGNGRQKGILVPGKGILGGIGYPDPNLTPRGLGALLRHVQVQCKSRGSSGQLVAPNPMDGERSVLVPPSDSGSQIHEITLHLVLTSS